MMCFHKLYVLDVSMAVGVAVHYCIVQNSKYKCLSLTAVCNYSVFQILVFIVIRFLYSVGDV